MFFPATHHDGSHRGSSVPAASTSNSHTSQSIGVTNNCSTPRTGWGEILKHSWRDASQIFGDICKTLRPSSPGRPSISAAMDKMHQEHIAELAKLFDEARTATAASNPNTWDGNKSSYTKEEAIPSAAARSVAGAFFSVLEAKRTEYEQKEKTDNLYAQNNLNFFPEQPKLVRMTVARQTAERSAQEEWAKYKKENPGEGSIVSQWLIRRGVSEEDIDSLMESLGGCSMLNGTEVPEVKRGWRDS